MVANKLGKLCSIQDDLDFLSGKVWCNCSPSFDLIWVHFRCSKKITRYESLVSVVLIPLKTKQNVQFCAGKLQTSDSINTPNLETLCNRVESVLGTHVAICDENLMSPKLNAFMLQMWLFPALFPSNQEFCELLLHRHPWPVITDHLTY